MEKSNDVTQPLAIVQASEQYKIRSECQDDGVAMVTTNHESEDEDQVRCRLGFRLPSILLGPGTGEVDWLAAWLGPATGERDKPAATWPETAAGGVGPNASLVRLPSCRWEPTCDAVGRKPNGVTYPAGIPTCAADPLEPG